jgi:hypothetical protein
LVGAIVDPSHVRPSFPTAAIAVAIDRTPLVPVEFRLSPTG